jgi:hypothetical protein
MFYEEALDWNLFKLLPQNQRIEKVQAFKLRKPRLIGDIGLRAFLQLRKRALHLLNTEKFDFIYITIPSFYISLLGPWLYRRTGVRYGIDYIDPWVHVFPGSEKIFSRHWLSTQLAKLLEPKAVKSVSLITGVAEAYYKGVLERNPHLLRTSVCGAMPYGGEVSDHAAVTRLQLKSTLFNKTGNFQIVYAGAMLPKAYGLLEQIFKSIQDNQSNFTDVEFHFIGTGKKTNDPHGFTIKPFAEKYGIWQTNVFEYPVRIPYLDVLAHLNAADAVFILGSTEPHYTPSKTYQGVLSEKPLFAVLHQKSTAVDVIQKTNAGHVLSFKGEEEIDTVYGKFHNAFINFRVFAETFNPKHVNRKAFEEFSAYSVTKKLSELIEQAVSFKSNEFIS